MKKALRLALPVIVVLAVAGTALLCWLSPSKPKRAAAVLCPPVRTALATIALVENPTAKTYAAFGEGANAFTNVFEHAGLARVTNALESCGADLVFVSGESAGEAICRAKEFCATNGILAIHFDVRKKTFDAFRRELEMIPNAWPWRLWFPGRSDCLVTVFGAAPRLADMMDLFTREGLFVDLARAGMNSIEPVFASYVGEASAVMPVFGFAKGEVVPECFVTKDVPLLNWIDFADVDTDIRDRTLLEMRSMMVVRRGILRGDIRSRAGDMNGAMEEWTRAIKRNPDDPLILERICQLDVNAETFMKVGNFPMAAQCLETMVCLRPKDVQLARRLARVLNQAGKKDLAAAVNKRADEMVKAELKARKANR